jgi:uncharacterized protein YbcI
MPETIDEQTAEGPLTATISDAISRLVHEHTGRGPSSAWTTLGRDLIVCVMADGLTKGEQRLVEHGRSEAVLQTRKAFQETMRIEAIREIEELSGRRVKAFMSANHIDPDLGVEIFVLDAADSPNGEAAARDGLQVDGLR